MYSVYTIYNNKHKKIYIGQTNEIIDRMKLHNNHVFKNSYTSRFDGEWQVIYNEEVPTRREALKREKQLKSYRGRQFVKQYIPG